MIKKRTNQMRILNFFKNITLSKFHLLLIISSVAILLLLYFLYGQYSENKLNQDQLKAVTDTMTVYKTKDGKNAAQISILKGEKKDLILIAEKRDSELAKLIKETKNLKSVTKFSTKTIMDTVSKVDTMYVQVGDSSKKDSIYITKKIKNPYYTADIKIINDSLHLGLSTVDTISVVSREKSNGFLKRKTLVIDVIVENPYSSITGLNSFEVTAPKKRLIPKIIAVAAIVGGVLLLK